jgi:fatty acid desaturase
MTALAGGLAALILGIIGIILWWGEFIELLMGAVPVMLLLGGALAAYLGFEELKDKKATESFEDTTSDLKEEVKTLKEEIQGLKEEKGKEETQEEQK